MKASNFWRWIIVLIFAVSLAALGYYVFVADSGVRRTAGPGQNGGTYRQVAQLSLGQVEVKNYQRMGFTRGYLRFSPDSGRLAVGTETGQIIMLSREGTVLWQRPAGLGKVTAMEFSPDGACLYVGETSADGSLYCLDAASGREWWKNGLAAGLGVDLKRKSHPGIIRILTDRAGRVFALTQRYDRSARGESFYFAKIFCVNPEGKEIWRYPADEAMDAWVNWLSVDKQGRRIVFGTANFDTEHHYRYDKNAYCLDADSGLEAWSVNIEPNPPFQRTILRGSPNIAADGKYVAAMASDGRAILFDSQGQELWRRHLSVPKKIDEIYLNAVGRDAYVLGDFAVFTTINTYNNANWQLPTPLEHPSSNSLFIFTVGGQLVAKWRAGGGIEEIAYTSTRQLAAAVGRNTKSKDTSVHGVYLLDMPNAAAVEKLATEGPCAAVAISPDERLVAGIEAPLQLDDGSIIGGYRLWLWEKKAEPR